MKSVMDKLIDVTTVLSGVSAVAIAVVIVLGGARSGEAPPDRDDVFFDDWETYAKDGHRRGAKDAPITIVEFGDYRCPYCAEAEQHLDAIFAKYSDEVALVYRHLPLPTHQFALDAAEAAECAGRQGRFWEMHRLLFDDPRWTRGDVGESLQRLAGEAEVGDLGAFRRCYEEGEAAERISEDADAAEAIGFFGTPSFLVNGWILMGVLDSLRFDEVYEDFLK